MILLIKGLGGRLEYSGGYYQGYFPRDLGELIAEPKRLVNIIFPFDNIFLAPSVPS